jgi:asparagine synthase (glutamine-hydrolysing)
MCGICGVHQAEPRAIDVAVLSDMTSSLVHRGPDDGACHVDDHAGLGFRRLSIIDLAGGRQPMTDGRGIWSMCNGEIYNFPELRRELVALGHEFTTRSDSEVILHGYREWGDDVVHHLNGMFAFAVWDAERNRLVLARDRAGIKPLYWARHEDRLVFGSEIRAVLAGTGGKPTLDAEALALFLRYRYTPSPWTMYAGVQRLAPGHLLVSDSAGIRVRQWWNARPEPFDPAPNRAAAVDELADRYETAVRRQLMSDVPVGLLLSGGVDSTLLLELMSRHGTGWDTYTAGYGDDDAHDEIVGAAATADHFGARHHAVRLRRTDFEAELPRVVAAMEEPVTSPSVVPMDAICARARLDVKVVLVGQGPDELFGGYRRHLGIRYGHWWRALPRPVRAATEELVRALPRAATLKRAVRSLTHDDPYTRWADALSIESGSAVDAMFAPGTAPAISARLHESWDPIARLTGRADELTAFSYLELRSTLPDELLLYADKLSMAHGIEARVPYLDDDVVEYALRLPAAYKVHGRTQKWVHRQVCARRLPAEVLARRKRGFAAHVVDDWYRASTTALLTTTVGDPQSRMYEYLDRAEVMRLLAAHQHGHGDHHKVLHSLVVTELWMRANLA